MVTLGQTSNPLDLVPGDAGSVAEVVTQLYDYGVLLTEAGDGLSRIDTSDGWTGAAADAFRERFKGQPQSWLTAGLCFAIAAKALDSYIPVLVWAQNEAGVAIDQWAQGDKKGAQATLANAQSRLEAAADTANTAIGEARDKAPPHPGFWSDVGHFFSSAGHDLKVAGEDAVDALASIGNSVVQNPLADLGVVGGTALAGLSAGGEALGVGLDLTGVGAVVGVPVNVLSAAGMALGGSLAMASAADLGSQAAGDDRVEPFDASGGSGEPASTPDPKLTPGTPEYDQYIEDLSKDPAKGGAVNAKSIREAQVAVQAEADGLIDGPLTRPPLDANGVDQGDFTDVSRGQNWDVKGSPDLRPSTMPGAGTPISNPQTAQEFADMINKELGKGENVLLDPDGMSPGRLAQLQQVVENNPSWQGRVVWGQ
jgi:hypothetical protein